MTPATGCFVQRFTSDGVAITNWEVPGTIDHELKCTSPCRAAHSPDYREPVLPDQRQNPIKYGLKSTPSGSLISSKLLCARGREALAGMCGNTWRRLHVLHHLPPWLPHLARHCDRHPRPTFLAARFSPTWIRTCATLPGVSNESLGFSSIGSAAVELSAYLLERDRWRGVAVASILGGSDRRASRLLRSCFAEQAA